MSPTRLGGEERCLLGSPSGYERLIAAWVRAGKGSWRVNLGFWAGDIGLGFGIGGDGSQRWLRGVGLEVGFREIDLSVELRDAGFGFGLGDLILWFGGVRDRAKGLWFVFDQNENATFTLRIERSRCVGDIQMTFIEEWSVDVELDLE